MSHLLSGDGSIAQFLVGRVAPDDEVGGTEIVMSTSQADLLGATLSTSVLIYGQFNRGLRSTPHWPHAGSRPTRRCGSGRSWDPFDPDSTLGLAKTKKALGELAYSVTADRRGAGRRRVASGVHLPIREPYPTGIRAACNNDIKADLAAALQAVVDAGLAGLIDVNNANTFGGCFGPRFTRIVGTQLGTLSRHTWGQALDTNTTSNCQGCVPQMDCRIVRIFRAHNFAWGGNFIIPDGMHFEWVGEPRNTFLYPSRYCPNVPSGGIESFDGQSRQSAAHVRGRWMGARRGVSAASLSPGGNSIRDHRRRSGWQHCRHVRGSLGAEVTMVERDVIGGAAHLWDCIPSKTMIATGGAMSFSRRIHGMGLEQQRPRSTSTR